MTKRGVKNCQALYTSPIAIVNKFAEFVDLRGNIKEKVLL